MKIFTIINPDNISNIYLLTDDEQSEGLLIDPGSFAINVYNEIRNIGADIKKIVITHNDPSKIRGIPVIKKMYDVEIFTHNSSDYDFKTTKVKNGDLIELGKESGVVLETPIKSYDSISLKFSNNLFVGDILQTGALSSIDKSGIPTKLELSIIRKHFLDLPDNTIIYPEKGPATSIKIEKTYNPYFKKVIRETAVNLKEI